MKQVPHLNYIHKLLLIHGEMELDKLYYHLAITASEKADFIKILKQEINISKSLVISNKNIKLAGEPVLAKFIANKGGSGGVAKVISDNSQIIISKEFSEYAFDGDDVMVYPEGILVEGKMFGLVSSIIQHNTNKLIGSLDDNGHFVPNSARVSKRSINMLNSKLLDLEDGLYEAIVIEYPSMNNRGNLLIELDKFIGELKDTSSFVQMVLDENNIVSDFSTELHEFVRNIPNEVSESDCFGRVDLRKLDFVTIDGEDARDFDDAVFSEVLDNGNYQLYVAIADVAHYVEESNLLDNEAYLRGNSIYLPDRVIPMLPEKLSNGLCSLNQLVDRLVVVCQMEMNSTGEVINYSIYNGVIHSKARLTYSQVQGYLDGENTAFATNIAINITNLCQLFKMLLELRDKRGALDFDSVEPLFEMDDNGDITSISQRHRLDAHRLIEECMLVANQTVAKFLLKHEQGTLFRNHPKPDEKKLNSLKAYLNGLALKFDVNADNVTNFAYKNIVEQVKDRADSQLIQQSLLRSMQLAVYELENKGHFGLAYQEYLHFTSPIRRYPDLVVHRSIKQVIQNKKYMSSRLFNDMAEHLSGTERCAEMMERRVDSYLKCKYAKLHIGNSYDGVVTSITKFGLFVYINNLMIDGMLHISNLGKEYFVFDEETHTLRGKTNGFRYKIGQALSVTIASVNLESQFIDLTLDGVN